MLLGSRLALEAEARRLLLVRNLAGHDTNETLLRKACERAYLDVVEVRCSVTWSPQETFPQGAEAAVLTPESGPS